LPSRSFARNSGRGLRGCYRSSESRSGLITVRLWANSVVSVESFQSCLQSKCKPDDSLRKRLRARQELECKLKHGIGTAKAKLALSQAFGCRVSVPPNFDRVCRSSSSWISLQMDGLSFTLKVARRKLTIEEVREILPCGRSHCVRLRLVLRNFV
jgi:hypothetical protein